MNNRLMNVLLLFMLFLFPWLVFRTHVIIDHSDTVVLYDFIVSFLL